MASRAVLAEPPSGRVCSRRQRRAAEPPDDEHGRATDHHDVNDIHVVDDECDNDEHGRPAEGPGGSELPDHPAATRAQLSRRRPVTHCPRRHDPDLVAVDVDCARHRTIDDEAHRL